MRAWIRPAALLIPALVISASCDDPDRPESGSWSGLEISWEDGYIAADLMPVVEPPPDYDPTSFAASLAIHNSGRSGYSGLEVESADVFLVDADHVVPDAGALLGTLVLESDWDGAVLPGQTRTVRIWSVGQTGEGIGAPCSQRVTLRFLIRSDSGETLSFASPELTFGCVY